MYIQKKRTYINSGDYMNLKKIIHNTIIIFLLFFPLHFLYSKTKITIFIPFAPVNESIWEHLKLFLSANLLYGLISLRKNYFGKVYVRSMIEIVIFLIIYLPLYYLFGENMIGTFVTLFVSIFLSEIVISFIDFDKYNSLNTISIFLILLNLTIFTYFSYHPLKVDLFRDPQNNSYGIKK